MKRFRLATKLALALVPLGLIALGAGYLLTQNFLDDAAAEERVAAASRVAVDATDLLLAVHAEQSDALAVAFGGEGVNLDARRSTVDAALNRLKASVDRMVPLSSGPASGIASTMVSNTRRVGDLIEDSRSVDPLGPGTEVIHNQIGSNLISVISQSTLFFGDEARAREGAGATSLARAALSSYQQEDLVARYLGGAIDTSYDEFIRQLALMESTTTDWILHADQSSPTVKALNYDGTQTYDRDALSDPASLPTDRDETVGGTAVDIFGRVAESASAAAEAARSEALTVAGLVLGVILVAAIFAVLVGRSMVRRVRSVTRAATGIADVELPKMVDSLRDPQGRLATESATDLELGGRDEVAELARSFSVLHSTLVDVANQQMDTLRRGVSEIFVTLARRNRSLVDRQLALVDQLESDEEDPTILEGYYRIDHIATRMRRNAESLLVLAGTEAPRMWGEPLEMGDVVRAALGEVDDYQRVDVLAVEPARLAGRAVTDVSHLLSELLDNATGFSPPSERVRVAGMFDDDGYVVTVSDNGIGLSETKLAQINQLIEEPPVLGLALDPTLGMYVVARLAKRHGIKVRLVAGVPGITARITIPRQLLEAGDGSDAEPDLPTEVEAVVESEPVVPPSAGDEPARTEQSTTSETDKERYAPIGPLTHRGGARHRVPDDPGELVAESQPASNESPPTPVETPSPAPTVEEPARTVTDRRPVSLPQRETANGALPTRNPGSSFRQDHEAEKSSSVSNRGADGIRDALSGFRVGRDTALGSPPRRTGEAAESDAVDNAEERSEQ